MSFENQPCRLFSLTEIRSATGDFAESLVIGRGGFGKVYKGRIGDEDVAVKRLFHTSTRDVEFEKEIKMVSKIRHCRLISLIGYCHEKDETILIYEYMPRGSLDRHLHKIGSTSALPWEARLKICLGADGRHYLHQGTGFDKRILHDDIKSANVLLDNKLEAKISDFGLSTVAPANTGCSYVVHNTLKFSRDYVDPQYLRTGVLTKESDVYSLGILLLEVICGRKAFDMKVRDGIREGRLSGVIDPNLQAQISEECLRNFVDIALKCLHKVSESRPQMIEVLFGLHKLVTSEISVWVPQDSCVIRREFLEDNGRGYGITETKQVTRESKDEINEESILSRLSDLSVEGSEKNGSRFPPRKISQTEEPSFLSPSSSDSPQNLLTENKKNQNDEIAYHLVAAEELNISGRQDLVCRPAETKFEVIAQTYPANADFKITCNVATGILSPDKIYAVFLVFNLGWRYNLQHPPFYLEVFSYQTSIRRRPTTNLIYLEPQLASKVKHRVDGFTEVDIQTIVYSDGDEVEMIFISPLKTPG